MEGTISSNALQPRALSSRAREAVQLAALVGALALLGAGGTSLREVVHPPRKGEVELNSAGWEGRRLAAQFLWLKTHAVLHAGVEERAARAGEEKTRAGEFHQHGAAEGGHGHGDGHDDGHGEEGHVLAIPPAREDFRGMLGDLEREIKPYKDKNGKMYEKDAQQTIPFYRLMTWADPHFVQGYTIGATFIADAGKYADKGLLFLHEGERNNPLSFEIQTELGHFYLVYKKDFPRAEHHFRRALQLLPGERKLTDLEQDSRDDLFHWAALNYVEWGRPEDAVRVARRGITTVGGDKMLQKIVDRRGAPIVR